jgi:hypothetical protein
LTFGAAVLASGPLGLGLLQDIPGSVGIVALLIGAGLLGWFLLGSEELLLSASEVRRHYRWPLGTFSEQRVRADEVEDVAVATAGDQGGAKVVRVIADRGTVSFGATLTAKQLRWVRDCVVAVIGAAGGHEVNSVREQQ